MANRLGKQTVTFSTQPRLHSSYTIVGPLEGGKGGPMPWISKRFSRTTCCGKNAGKGGKADAGDGN